ncbi:MAG: two-component regulator propeller domain-containing protein [bacterium]
MKNLLRFIKIFMLNKVKYYIFIIMLIAFSISIISKDYYHEKIDKDKGFYDGKVVCGFEDSRGFIWLGTTSGLYRYDGKESVAFKHDYSDTNSIADNYVQHIVEDKDGSLWVSNEEGIINRLNPATGKFKRYELFDSEKMKTTIVVMIPFIDSTGKVWFSGFTRINSKWFLAKYNRGKDKFELYHFDNEYVDSVYRDNPFFPRFTPGRNGDIIVKNLLFKKSFKFDSTLSAKEDVRLLVFNPEKKTLKLLKNYKNYDYEKIIAPDDKGNLLIEVHTDEIPFHIIKLNLKNYQYSETNYYCDKRWYQEGFMVTTSYFDGKMFFTVNIHDGVSEKHLKDFCGYYQFNDSNYLPFDKSYQIHSEWTQSGAKSFYWKNKFFSSTNKIIWDYLPSDLIKIVPATNKVKTIPIPQYSIDSSVTTISSLLIDSDKKLWIGTNKGLYNFTYPDNFQYYYYKKKNLENRKNRITDIKEYDKNTLLISTLSGLFYFDKRKGEFIDYSEANSLEPYNETLLKSYINSLLVDKDEIWYGTLYGLKRHVKGSNKIKSYFPSDTNKFPISDYVTYEIFKDKIGNIWVGTFNGLNKYLPEYDGFKIYKSNPKDKYSISGNEIKAFCEDKNNNLWIATDGIGLNKYNPVQDNFTVIGKDEGLPCNYISNLICDNNNNLWLSTDIGLIKYEKSSGKFTKFSKNDDPESDKFYFSTAILNESNELILGSKNGLTYFSPKDMKVNSNIPKIVVTKLFINDSLISYYLKDGDTIKKDWNSDYLKIYFAALDYIAPQLNQYAYIIDGINDDWIYLGTQNSIILAGIEPGNYILRITASNNDAVWNEKGIMIHLIIVPPFWMTIWFKILVVLIIIGLFSYLILLKNRRKLEREKTKQRILSFQLKALHSQMNPHFIFNSLNSILNLILIKETEKAMSYLTMFSRLLRKVLENSMREYVPLNSELELLKTYLELEKLRFDEKFDYWINISPEINTHEERIPTMVLQPYIENCIKHGFSKISTQGKIFLEIQKKGAFLHCIITDNGIGRKTAEEMKKNNGIQHKSVGTNVSKERLKLLNSHEKITDMVDDNGNPVGTKVELTIYTQINLSKYE